LSGQAASWITTGTLRAYGTDVVILVRPDGYIGLVADPTELRGVAEYFRSL